MGNSPRYLGGASSSARGFSLLASVIGREYTEGMQRIASWSALYLRLALRALVRRQLPSTFFALPGGFPPATGIGARPFFPSPPPASFRGPSLPPNATSIQFR